jgi:hypothetical protein
VIDSEPLQVIDLELFVFRVRSFQIGVFDTKNEGSTYGLGIKIIVESGSSTPDVEVTRRRWRESYADRHDDSSITWTEEKDTPISGVKGVDFA